MRFPHLEGYDRPTRFETNPTPDRGRGRPAIVAIGEFGVIDSSVELRAGKPEARASMPPVEKRQSDAPARDQAAWLATDLGKALAGASG
jgi:hypothetical protein